VENERESKGNYMALEPENYLLLDAIHKKKRKEGQHIGVAIPKNGNYLIRALDIRRVFFFIASSILLILPLFFLQSVRSFFITLSAEVRMGILEHVQDAQVAPLRAI